MRSGEAPGRGDAAIRRTTIAGLFGALAGPLAWSVQLWVLYLAADYPCRASGGSTLLGLPVEAWWVVVSAAAGAVTLGALVASVRVRSITRRAPANDGRTAALRFLGVVGILSSALFLAVIVLGATAPLFVPCAP